jgi:hypothetical protein
MSVTRWQNILDLSCHNTGLCCCSTRLSIAETYSHQHELFVCFQSFVRVIRLEPELVLSILSFYIRQFTAQWHPSPGTITLRQNSVVTWNETYQFCHWLSWAGGIPELIAHLFRCMNIKLRGAGSKGKCVPYGCPLHSKCKGRFALYVTSMFGVTKRVRTGL